MTDKAAREAFEKLYAEWPLDQWLTNPERYADPDTQKRWEGFYIGYQAAHDAAMAAEPDVQEVEQFLKRIVVTAQDHTLAAAAQRAIAHLAALLLQLQAAQQREAECRKVLEQLLDDVHNLTQFDYELEGYKLAQAALATQPASKGETT